ERHGASLAVGGRRPHRGSGVRAQLDDRSAVRRQQPVRTVRWRLRAAWGRCAVVRDLCSASRYGGCVTAPAGFATRAGRRSRGAALDGYRLDNGRYPTTAQGLGALWQAPTQDPLPSTWKGPYLRKEVPLDPWGRAYAYTCPGEHNPAGYDLVSLGADGQPGGGGEASDVVSWK